MKPIARYALLLLFLTVPFLKAQEAAPSPQSTPSPKTGLAGSSADNSSSDLIPNPTPVPADLPQASDEGLLDEVVVTSDRLPTPKDQVAGSISVLTARDIERQQLKTVAQALREIPGVDVIQDGGDGKTTTVSIRASGPSRTLVFVDGVEMNDSIGSGGDGLFNFANLTTDNVERIEVLRGSQSALYGPDATGGVIQIFTKKGQGPLQASLTGETGSQGYLRSGLGLNGGDRWLDYSIQVSHFREDGFSAAAPNASHTLPLEDDGTQNTVVSSQFGSNPFSFLTLRLIQRYTESKTDVDDGAFNDDPNHINLTRDSILKGEVETRFFDRRWQQILSFSQTLQHFTDVNDTDLDHPYDVTRSFYNGRREQFDWQNNLRLLLHHTFSFGFENRQEWGDATDHYEYLDGWTLSSASSDSSFTRKTNRDNGWFLQDQTSYGDRFFLSAGARFDRHDTFGTRATWRLAPAYIVPITQTKLKTTLGTGWRTPTLYQLYSDYGNPSLRAERSLAWDAGFEQPFLRNRFRLNAVYFDQRYKNYLDYDLAKWAYCNTPRVRTRGAETSLDGRFYKDSLVHLSVNYTEAKNLDTREPMQGRPLHRASLALDSPSVHGARVGFEVLYTGRRKNPVWMPDYTLVRLHVDWKATNRMKIFARVENLFGRRYQEYDGYQTSPRAFFAGSTLSL